MSDNEIEHFSKKFDENCKSGHTTIGPNEFVNLYKEIEGDQATAESAKIFFRGIDINNSGDITKSEFLDCVKETRDGLKINKYKMIFRSFDVDRSRTLTCEEIVEYTKFCNKPKTIEELKPLVKQYGKGKDFLTFAQLYKLMTGEDIPEDTDPYNGKIPLGKSGCCLLL
uniref:EF-hand family protein n=1 Tax=Coptotermes formosanus TaxID=36987 RepID=R4V3J0_COPFO|nr:EF-hand family protein [Coptotermes formosanus]